MPSLMHSPTPVVFGRQYHPPLGRWGSFDGGDHLLRQGDPTIDTTDEIWFGGWSRLRVGAGGAMGIWSFADTGVASYGAGGFQVQRHNNGKLLMVCNGTSTGQTAGAANYWANNVWVFAVTRLNRTTGRVYYGLYKNGTWQNPGVGSNPNTWSDYASNAAWITPTFANNVEMIGAHIDSSGNPTSQWDGDLGPMVISKTAMTPAQLLAASMARPFDSTTMEAGYAMNLTGDAQVIADEAGNGHTLQLGGSGVPSTDDPDLNNFYREVLVGGPR